MGEWGADAYPACILVIISCFWYFPKKILPMVAVGCHDPSSNSTILKLDDMLLDGLHHLLIVGCSFILTLF